MLNTFCSNTIFYLSFLELPMKAWKQGRSCPKGNLCIEWPGIKWKFSWLGGKKFVRVEKKRLVNVRNLHLANLVILCKWMWRLLHEGHISNQGLISYLHLIIFGVAQGHSSGILLVERDVYHGRHEGISVWLFLHKGFWNKVDNDMLTSFWHELWVRGISLRARYQRLFHVSR